ncbi:MAG: hypothetical protein JSS53_01085 [Proteobacteria bacterium]|nr:hypothetical protein [Pseudomonadota bacterium]
MATNSNLKCNDIFEVNAKGQYPLGAKFNNDYLTKREIDVIKWILQGYSAKKVGLSMNISV